MYKEKKGEKLSHALSSKIKLANKPQLGNKAEYK